MTWLRNLFETYESNQNLIGVFQRKSNNQEYALIPLSHSTSNAQIEVTLDMEGNLVSASVIEKEDASTVIPCTEDSASRSGREPAPHPLHDKLIYVAGDYVKYGGSEKSYNPHAKYMEQLKSWCESEHSHPKVNAVYKYLLKGRLVEDLIAQKVIFIDGNNKFIEKWEKKSEEELEDKPAIYRVISSGQNQSDAFVRFSVNETGVPESRLWRDSSVFNSFINYYSSTMIDNDLCYVTGTDRPSAEKHASKIRHAADMAKLISSNDSTGFTYRGRFITSKEAASVSYEVSQKAHNALKWLVARQGILIGGEVFLVWGTKHLDLPNPFEGTDNFELFADFVDDANEDITHQQFANQVKKAISGYRHSFEHNSNVIIMAVDAATPGRMAIVYYRDMDKHLFLDRLESWHTTCFWRHQYKSENGKRITFFGAPATKDIAFAAYGLNASDKVVKGLVERMLPSILDRRPVPRDIEQSVFNRASNPVGMDNWEWEKTLSITCAIFNRKYKEEGFSVSLDEHNEDRNYLFGRLLAIADVLESRALFYNGETRATNAMRYMQTFSQQPRRTWKIIQSNIAPYQAKYVNRFGYFQRLLDEVGAKFKPMEFSDESLNGLYLLGYYSQRHALNSNKSEKVMNEGEMNDDDFES